MGFPHLVLELFVDQRVGRRALDVDGESVEFVRRWRYPRLPILPQGRHNHQTMTAQPLLPQRSQLRVLLRKFLPVHVKASEIKEPEVVSKYYYFYVPGASKNILHRLSRHEDYM